MRALLIVAVLTACGGSPTPPRSNVDRDPIYTTGNGNFATPPPDAAVAFTAPGLLACPSSYAELGGSCDPQVSRQACNYPEGSCYCGIATPCSGAEPDPAEIAAIPPTWQCRATPPAVRPDGCPGVEPGDVACKTEGKVCSWGDCCFTQMTCTKGEWLMTGGGCPP